MHPCEQSVPDKPHTSMYDMTVLKPTNCGFLMQTVFDFIRSHSEVLAFVLLIIGVALWHTWDFRIRPLFIPKAEINAIVDKLIAEHGPAAEDRARGYEEEAWSRSDTYEQGKWRRVRRELWRRYREGGWE